MPLQQADIPGYPVYRGKVRDVFDLGDRLVIFTTDRISAFDWVLPTLIPDKGANLTRLSQFWFDYLGLPHHWMKAETSTLPDAFQLWVDRFPDQGMIVRKAHVIPFECVARGYLAGSAWKEYRERQAMGDIALPSGLEQSAALPEAIFTPATKATTGHDVNVNFDVMADAIGVELATRLRTLTLDVYRRASAYAANHGILIADTKLEWGITPEGELLLVDEVLTPDSSRFWDASAYRVGISPPSFDKQIVRDWLEQSGWDKNSPPPELPVAIAEQTRQRYQMICDRLIGGIGTRS